MNLIKCLKELKKWRFVGGVVTGLVLVPLAKSKAARKAAVNLTAKGMAIKDCAMEAYESIREDAQDICAEAKQKSTDTDGPDDDVLAE